MENFALENLIYQAMTKLDEGGENESVTYAMSIVRVAFDAERKGRKLSADEVCTTAIAAATCE